MKNRHSIIVVSLAILFVFAPVANAHDSRPLYVEITETPNGQIHLSIKLPPSLGAMQTPKVLLGKPCYMLADTQKISLQGQNVYACPQGLDDVKMSITYPSFNPSLSTFVKVKFNTGEIRTALMGPAKTEWFIPKGETFTVVAINYFKTGFKHILGGYDHLLFLVGLLFIARTPRRVLLTITGFTVAHSITLVLVALDAIHISTLALEMLIALSIVFLANEIARNNQNTLTWRYPVIVSSGFGLVHGGGFASALTDIGLPQTEKITGLLFFNLGIEASQIFTILILLCPLLVFSLLQQRVKFRKYRIHSILGYSLGIVATYWLFTRINI